MSDHTITNEATNENVTLIESKDENNVIEHNEDGTESRSDSNEASDNESNGNEDTGPKMMQQQDFKDDLRELLDLSQQVKSGQAEIKKRKLEFTTQMAPSISGLKVLKERAEELEVKVKSCMEKAHCTEFTANGVLITLCDKKSKKKLDKEYLRNTLDKHPKLNRYVDDLTKLLFERPTTTSKKIKLSDKK